MAEIIVAAFGVLTALITGFFAVRVARASRESNQSRPPVSPSEPPGTKLVGSPEPRQADTRPPRPIAPVSPPTPSDGPEWQELPLVKDPGPYAGRSGDDLEVTFLADAELTLEGGDRFMFRDLRDDEKP